MSSEPKLVACEALEVAGIAIRTNNASERDPATARIPGLWKRFFGENIAGQIPNGKPGAAPLGVYTDYESDHTGPYSLIAGLETSAPEPVPHGMRRLTIPAGRYLVFTAAGPMPQALIAGWMHIWSYFSTDTRYRRAYTADFERYAGPERVEIHIAVK